MQRSILMVIILAVATLAMADAGVTRTKGGELFISKQLGTNGKSCSSCHPDGKGMANTVHYDDAELGSVINQCIRNPLKGKPLVPDSAEMKALITYIRSVAPIAQK